MEQVKQKNSVQDKVILDNSYIESAIFALFRIDLINYIKVKSILAKEFHIQPSEIDKMPAWEYEIFMKEINDAVKEENERNKAEMDKAGLGDAQKMTNPNNISKMQKAAMPKMPTMPSMPSINVSSKF